MKYPPEHWPALIVALRKSGLNQVQIAVEIGCAPCSVSKWASGTVIPSGPHAVALVQLAEGRFCSPVKLEEA